MPLWSSAPSIYLSWNISLVLKLVSAFLSKLLGWDLPRWLFPAHQTTLKDLALLGKERSGARLSGQAVVCGGSISGLLAAAVCAQHFNSVVIIDADPSASDGSGTEPGGKRTRVMQYSMTHTFLPLCLMGLRQLFTNLDRELAHLGISSAPLKMRLNQEGIAIPDAWTEEDAPQTLPITRSAYENLLRRLVVTSRPNVRFVTGTVVGYQGYGDRLEGARIRKDKGEKIMKGDLIVDATGPAQLSFYKWLKKAGFPIPSSIKVQYDSPTAYSHCMWKIPPHTQEVLDTIIPSGFQPGLMYAHRADRSRGEKITLGVSLVEDAQLILVVLQLGGDHRINSISDLRVFVQTKVSFVVPRWIFDLIDVLGKNESECPPRFCHGRSAECSYVKYHELADREMLPRNWLAVGDAAMALNYQYALGVSKAMIDAITLDSVLRTTPTGGLDHSNFSKEYFKKVDSRTRNMWETTKASDYGTEVTTPSAGETLVQGRLSRALGRQFLSTAGKDPEAYSTWFKVNMLLAPETDLFSPLLLAKVAKNWIIG